MLIILSPSKTIDISKKTNSLFTKPRFLKESSRIVSKIKKLNTSELSKLMNISPKLAQQTFDKYQFWNNNHTLLNSNQAILSFKGEVYTGLNASFFTEKDLIFSQEHLIMLSGLYGVLRPLDLIQAYRLEISTKLSILSHSDLYSYWSAKIIKELNNILNETSNDAIINLASNEYFKSIDIKKLKADIITPIFKENKDGVYKIISIYAKKARGLMSNYIVKNRINNVSELKLFNEEGYYFNENISFGNEIIFTRG